VDSLLPATFGERLHGRAEDCLEQAAETADPESSRLWHKLALDCMRIAAAVRTSEQEGVTMIWASPGVIDCS
jgi:hypothetical protein